MKQEITMEYIRDILIYNQWSGEIWWNRCVNRQWGGKIPNKPAGKILPNGYRQIGINKKSYYAHRLAWLYMTGLWPCGEIDHINGDKLDNRWNNLRTVTRTVNAQNKKRCQKNNKCGYLGVCYDKSRNKWEAKIKVNEKHLHLGRFTTSQEAYQCYLRAKREFHLGNTL